MSMVENMADVQVSQMKYSVLMSVYAKDVPAYVKQAIDSMLGQTVAPEQFVIVEDGPLVKETGDLIEEYEKDLPDVFTVIKLCENKGLANALNIGLEACRNELVARMDADDVSKPLRCERELEMFRKDPGLAVCGCNLEEFQGTVDNVKTIRAVPLTYENVKTFSKRRQPVNHATVIYKKTIVMHSGGYIPTRRKEDFDLFSRILSKGYRIRNIKDCLYSCRTDADNYQRRKSFVNFKTAVYVYARHMKRGGCNLIDFMIICGGEFIFFILPQPLMAKLSDLLLREKV